MSFGELNVCPQAKSHQFTRWLTWNYTEFRLSHESLLNPIETWSRLDHPNIVRVREAFTTRAFNDNCNVYILCVPLSSSNLPYQALIVCYDYHPLAVTLYDEHIKSQPQPIPVHRSRKDTSTPEHISEAILWSYIIQLASAIKTVHDRGLAIRTIDPTKILLTGKDGYQRIRINCCGIADVVMHDPRIDVTFHQVCYHCEREPLRMPAHISSCSKKTYTHLEDF